MAIRIFGVEYWIKEWYNGKDANSFKEDKSVVAKDAAHALRKVEALNSKKPFSAFIDDDTKKKIIVTRTHFEPLSVILRASTD